ncbi:MAG TPA: hypothetical protein VK487_02610 [Candidatus Bathyarchaeia archaeon]|nr:hypothetical protein [Candidatus Bathyarchaeia archaeon]
MHTFIKARRFATIILIILSVTLGIFSFLPRALALVHPVLTITRNEGYVGETVTVNGSSLTHGGKYAIFFDNISVLTQNKTANDAGNFTDTTFVVPPEANGTYEVKLYDISSGNMSSPVNFTIETAYYVRAINIPAQPNQLQEGAQVEIQANMTGGDASTNYSRTIRVYLPSPANSTYYNATVALSTNQNGTASNSTLVYPGDFTNGAHTNYTGTYQIRLYSNATNIGAKAPFVIGLTNATLYQRLDFVDIKATNYTAVANENATVIIKFSNETLVSRKIQALYGTVTFDTWQVPVNSSEGSYMVTVTAIGSVNKTVPDTQNFTVPGVLLNIKTINLNGANVTGVSTTVYENETLVARSSTNSSGWATSTLTRGGNYTLKAFWEGAFNPVNTTNVFVEKNSSWILRCQIADLEFIVKDSANRTLPLVLLNVTATYLTSENVSETAIEDNLTSTGGEGIFSNQLVMANYTIRAYRAPYQAQLLFNTTKLFANNSSIAQFVNQSIPIICPLLSLTVHAEDAKNAPLAGYPVQIYEFAGGPYPLGNETTDASGNVTFTASLGEYQVRLYNPNETILLNETYYNLVNASAFFLMRSSICHANLSVTVLDYLGLPMSNVEVELERDGAATVTLKTNEKGVAFFNGIIGGNCFISISAGTGSPIGTANVFVEGNSATTVTVGGYVSVFGLLVGTSQFAVILTFIVFIVLLLFFLFYRRRSQVQKEKKTETES